MSRPKTSAHSRELQTLKPPSCALDRLAVTSSRPTTGAVNHFKPSTPTTPQPEPRKISKHLGPPAKGYPGALPIYDKLLPKTEYFNTLVSQTYSSEYKRNFSREGRNPNATRSTTTRPTTADWATPPAPWRTNAELEAQEAKTKQELRLKIAEEFGSHNALIKQTNSWSIIRSGSTIDSEDELGVYLPRGPRGKETLRRKAEAQASISGARPQTGSRPATSSSRPKTCFAVRPHSTKPIKLDTLRNPTTAKLNDAPVEVTETNGPNSKLNPSHPPPSRAGSRPPTGFIGRPGTGTSSIGRPGTARLHTAGSRLNTAATEVDICGQHESLSGQFEPMVLNLEHMEDSTLEVLEAELARSESEGEEEVEGEKET